MDEDCIIVKVHSPENGKKSEATEKSSSKKLKQTLLCFKAVDSNLAVPSISNTQPSKKRRLSDASAFSKSAKNAKKAISDTTKRKSVGGAVDEGDKEVSSSCEMEGIQMVPEAVVNNSRPGNSSNLLMKFIHTAQRVEVSTTSSKDGEMAVDNIAESENEAEPSSSGESKDWASQDETRTENKENIPDSDESSQQQQLKNGWSSLAIAEVSSKGLTDNDVVKGTSDDEDANQVTTVSDVVVRSVIVDQSAVREMTSEESACHCTATVKNVDGYSVVDEKADKGASDELDAEFTIASNDAVRSITVDSTADKGIAVEGDARHGSTVDVGAVVGATVSETLSTDGAAADQIVPCTGDAAAKKLQSVSSSDVGKVASTESCEMEVEEELEGIQGKSDEQGVCGHCTSQEPDSCKFTESPFNQELPRSEEDKVDKDDRVDKVDKVDKEDKVDKDDTVDIEDEEMSENIAQPKVKTKRPKVPFPSTKKQKMEEQDKELSAKKKQKEELEQQKKEKKEEKERARQEAKMQKEKERLEKEKEKEEKKRQKEEERLKKQEQLEEEKKKKEEARLEEKKRKEEERRKKEEEKQDKVVGSKKEKQLMQNFFFKTTKDTNSSVQQQNEAIRTGPFMPFELKKDMRLAPISRFDSSVLRDRAANLDSLIISQSSTQLYLDELRRNVIRPGKSGKMWPREDLLAEDVVLVEVVVTASVMKAKLFQFSENYRPAYYGTWRKRSGLIRGRRPFAKDTNQLDYELDSDDEWEEVEPGESLSHSEGEDETEPDAEPDDDEDASFMVPHGYLSEGEGCEDEDDDVRTSPDELKACQLAKARNWDAAINTKQRFEALHPVCIGICWWTPDGNTDSGKLKEYEAELFEPQPIALPDLSCCSSQDESKRFRKEHRMKQKGKEKGIIYIPVPEAAVPDLIRLVHGNEWSIFKVVKEFQEFWRFKNVSRCVSTHEVIQEVESAREHDAEENSEENLTLISKRKLDAKIRQIAVYERRPSIFHKRCWYVSSDSLEKYALTGLPVPNQWKWTTKLPNKSRKSSVKAAASTGDIEEVAEKLKQSRPDSMILPLLAGGSACASEGGRDVAEPVTDEGSLRKKTEETDTEATISKQIVKKSVMKKRSVKRLGKTKTLTINSSSIHCFVTGATGQSKTTSGNMTLKSKPSTSNDRLTQNAVANALSKNPLVVLKKLKSDAINNQPLSLPSSSGAELDVIPSAGQLSILPLERSSDSCLSEPKRQNLKEEVDNDCIIVRVEKKSASRTVPKPNSCSNQNINAE